MAQNRGETKKWPGHSEIPYQRLDHFSSWLTKLGAPGYTGSGFWSTLFFIFGLP